MHTDESNSHDPGQQPILAHAAMDFSSPYAPVDASEVHSVRPTGMTVISVLCILGGIVGVLVGLGGIAQIFLAETFANLASAGTAPGGMADAQREMQQQMQAVANQFFIPNLLALIAKLTIASFLLVGGIGLIRNKFSAVKLLRRTLLAAIGLEFIYMILQGFVQWNMWPILQDFMTNVSASANGKDSGAPGGEVMSQMMAFGMVLGVAFVVVWALIKVAIMIWSRIYLGRPAIAEYLAQHSSVTH